MHRPDAHVTDTCGRTQLRTALESLGWTVNPIENDYGSDFEVEVLRIPMMSISHSDLMPIRSERSDAGLSQCEIVIGISQDFCLFSLS
jgi:hypothetical protein